MGQKHAKYTYVDQFGTNQDALMTWKGCDADLEEPGFVRFAVFENADEYARNNKKLVLTMPITPSEVLEMFNRNGNVALEISDISWEKAKTKKFIYSRNPETLLMEAYSLDELEAEIIDIGLPNL